MTTDSTFTLTRVISLERGGLLSQLVNKFHACKKPEGSLPYSQKLGMALHLETAEISPHFDAVLF
jgi:hypothetical protein